MSKGKLPIDLECIVLGKIDLLVDRGIYKDRAEFFSSATGAALDKHSIEFEDFVHHNHTRTDEKGTSLLYAFGKGSLTKSDIEKHISGNSKLSIRVIGVLSVSKKVTTEEIMHVVRSCKVYGKIIASKPVKEALENLYDKKG